MTHTKRIGVVVAAALVVAAGICPALAEDDGAKNVASGGVTEKGVCPVCGWVEPYKKVGTWLEWGGDFRARAIYDKNVTTLDDQVNHNERFWQRYRTRLWARVTPIENIAFNIRLVHETFNFCRPATGDLRDWNGDEIIIDKLNVVWSNAFDLPLTVKVGRQDIIFGDGWLILDGTPADGSRTIHFDAARLTYEMEEANTVFDVIYFDNEADSGRWLKPINDRDRHLNAFDTNGAIIYVTNKSMANTELQGYFIYNHEDWETVDVEADQYTPGFRVKHVFSDHLEARGEMAGQFGERDGRDICAMGVNSRVTYALRDDWENRLHLDYEYRSGDDDDTDDRTESFDVLWGKWPQFSNIWNGYADRLDAGGASLVEGQPAASANLHRVAFRWDGKPWRELKLAASYQLLFADENNQEFDPETGRGCFRGQLGTLVAQYPLTPNITANWVGEVFCPGDYYAAGTDPAYFTWVQFVMKW